MEIASIIHDRIRRMLEKTAAPRSRLSTRALLQHGKDIYGGPVSASGLVPGPASLIDPRSSGSLTRRLWSWTGPTSADSAGPSTVSSGLLERLRNRTSKGSAS
jgi:hypothetical protein